MKVGDYVRTKEGEIGKITDIINNYLDEEEVSRTLIKFCEKETKSYYRGNCCYEEDIYKSSPNIIDLIEVEDYVNGSKLLSIDYAEDEYGNCDKLHFYYSFEDDEKDVNEYYEELKIKSIVTKEQFESMEYKIGEDK